MPIITLRNPLLRAHQATRRALDHGRVDVLTLRQQLRFAFVAAILGALLALAAAHAWWAARPAPKVTVAKPEYQRVAADYSVVRIPFEVAGQHAACHIVTYPTKQSFTVECEQ